MVHRICFFSSSDFGSECLNLLSFNFNVVCVVTKTPKEAFRGKKVTKNVIHEKAISLNIPVVHSFENLPDFDFGVVVSYGRIIPKSVLDLAKKGFLNIHPSDLPLFRGAAPIERTIEAGFSKSSVCVIKMTPNLDDGDVLARFDFEILQTQNSIYLHHFTAKKGAEILLSVLQNNPDLKNGVCQNHDFSTYAKKIDKTELKIDLDSKSFLCSAILNKIRAFASYGYCYTIFNDKRIKIISASYQNFSSSPLDICCQDGFIFPQIVKPEGGREVNITDFLNRL